MQKGFNRGTAGNGFPSHRVFSTATATNSYGINHKTFIISFIPVVAVCCSCCSKISMG
jgi:hypothetical protein